MNERAVIGGNHPPEPIDPMEAIQAQYDDTFAEVANWLDGSPVENEAQMKAVDALIANVKDAEKAAKEAKEAEYRPHKAAGDAVIARWKLFLDDLERQRKGLAAAVDGFKRKLAAEKAEAERKARAEAEAKMRAAREAEERANAADLEAQRAAAKVTFGVPILCAENDAFRAGWQATFAAFDYEAVRKHVAALDVPVTRLMTLKQMTAFMEAFSRFWRGHGFYLTDPEALKYEVEFGPLEGAA